MKQMLNETDTENPKEAATKLLELICKFSRITGYKVSMQKSIIFQYNSNKLLKLEIEKYHLQQNF